MPRFVEQIEDKLAQPSGIATLDSSGKLAQMPTAADVGAIEFALVNAYQRDNGNTQQIQF